MIRTLSSILDGAALRRMLQVKREIQKQGLVVPLNAETALQQGGQAILAKANVLEVYLRARSEATCEADIQTALIAIRELRNKFPNAFIGAGSADQPDLAAKAIKVGADFIISQGFVPDTVKLCAAHGVLCILGADDCVSISQYVQLMNEQYRFYVSDDELAELGMTRAQAEMHIVKFFNAAGRMQEFDGLAATYIGKGIRFLIAGGVTVADPIYHIDQKTVLTDQSIASWSSRPIVCAVTSSAMMKDNIPVRVQAALDQVQFGRTTSPAKKG